MSVLQSRNRLIYFRVSEEELAQFRSMAERLGARSLSDLAREALHRLDEPKRGLEHESSLHWKESMKTLCNRVEEMHFRLEELTERLGTESSPLRAPKGSSEAA